MNKLKKRKRRELAVKKKLLHKRNTIIKNRKYEEELRERDLKIEKEAMALRNIIGDNIEIVDTLPPNVVEISKSQEFNKSLWNIKK